jgi:hypothetical protein
VRTEPSAPVVAHVVEVLLLVVALVLLLEVVEVGHTAIAVIAPLWKHASGYGTVKKQK